MDDNFIHAALGGDVERVQELLDQGIYINCTDNYGDTALHEAARTNHPEVARLLLERGADMEVKNRFGWTALHSAARRNKTEVVRLLLDHGAEINVQDDDGDTPLHHATTFNRLEAAQLLIERGADITATNKTGLTPLHRASYYGSVDVISLLVSKSADIDAADHDGDTPLHMAVNKNELQAVTCLVQNGASISMKNKKGETAFFIAAKTGKKAIFDYFLSQSADSNVVDSDANTMLHAAVEGGDLDIIKILMESVHIDTRNNAGETAFFIAAKTGKKAFFDYFLSQSADSNVVDSDANTMLHAAVEGGDLDIIKILMISVHIDTRNNAGDTAFFIAVRKGLTNIVDHFLSESADTTVVDPSGNTLMHVGVLEGNLDIIKRLMNRVNLDTRNNAGDTAFFIAVRKGLTNIVDHFLSESADTTVVDSLGNTLMHVGVLEGNLDIIKRLINRVNLDTRNNAGLTAFHYAAQKGVSEMFKLVPDQINVRDSKNNTPLITASQNGRTVTVRYLLKEQAPHSDVNDDGDTALHCAAANAHIRVVKHLVQAGADLNIKNKKGFSPDVIAKVGKRGKKYLEVQKYLAAVKEQRQKLASAPSDFDSTTTQEPDYYNAPTPLMLPLMSPRSLDYMMEDTDVETILQSDLTDTEDECLSPPTTPLSTSRQQHDPIFPLHTEPGTSRNVPTFKSEFAVPALPPVRPSTSGPSTTRLLYQKHDDSLHVSERNDVPLSENERLKALLADKTKRLAEKDQTIAEKDSKLIGKGKEISKKDKEAEENKAQLASKGKRIYELEQETVEKIAQKDAKLIGKGIEISKKEKEAEENKAQLYSKGKRIYEQDAKLVEVQEKYIKLLEIQPKVSDSENTDKVNSVKVMSERVQGLFSHSANYKLTKCDYENITRLMGYVCLLHYPTVNGSSTGSGLFLSFMESTSPNQPNGIAPGSIVACILTSYHHFENWNTSDTRGEVVFDKYTAYGDCVKFNISGVIITNKDLDYALLYVTDQRILTRFDGVPAPKNSIRSNIPAENSTMVLIGHPSGSHMQGDHIEVVDRIKLTQHPVFKSSVTTAAAGHGARVGSNLHFVEDNFRLFYHCNSFHGASGAPCFKLAEGLIQFVCIHAGGIYFNTQNPTRDDTSDYECGILGSQIIDDMNSYLSQLGLQWKDS